MSEFHDQAMVLYREGFRFCYANVWASRNSSPNVRFLGDAHPYRDDAIDAATGRPSSYFVAYRLRVTLKPGARP